MRGLFVVVVLMATLVSQGTAQLSFGPEFHISQYRTTEGDKLVVRLSARILTRPQVPPFNGSIDVDITAEDLPGGNAQFRSDYIVNIQNTSSRTFTVTFQPNQANSTENVIQVADDDIVEGTEAFRLRITGVWFFGQAAAIFRAPLGLTNTIADVTIEDDDFIAVSWIISEPIEVTEGEGVRLELFAKALGLYASPIEIGVVCAEVIATGVPPAYPDRDFGVLSGSTLEFTDVETLRSNSSNNLTLLIIDDNITEPCESFICTLQGGAVDRVRGVEPNRVTVRICDNDELLVHWATDVYVFDESQVSGTVELVTDSIFEVAQVSIQGFPRQIPDGDPNRFPSLVVPGPSFPGFAFDSTIERVFVRVPSRLFGDRIFGNAQVTQSGRSDAVNTINDFVFTPDSRSAFENFTIIDDDVLEFDEIFIAEFSFGPEIANNWNARQVDPITAFILIRDDDSVEVNFNENSYTVAESDGQVSVSLRIDGQFFVPVWAIVEIRDGTATDPEDYSSAVQYNVTFRQTVFTDGDEPGNTALSSPILIDITNDDIFEGVEYFQARIVETSDRFRVRIGQETVNITITDSVTVRYEEELYRVDEEAGYVTLALVLEGNASVPVTVSVRTLDLQDSNIGAAATASVDYIPSGPFDITFQPGSTRELFNVTIRDDGIPESSEFFNAYIVSAGPAGVVIVEPRQPLIEILDRDFVTVQYEEERYIVEEENGSVTLALVLDKVVPFDVTVIVNTLNLQDSSVGDAASVGVDYTPRGPFEITFPAGSIRQEYTVNITDDSIPENSEFFNADVNVPRAEDVIVVIGSPKQPLIEIQDLRDAVVAISLDSTAYSIFENEEVVTVNLTLNDTYREDIVVNVTVGELLGIPDAFRALGDVDFSTAGFPRQVTIPAGQTSVQFNISVIDDPIVERDEQFQVSFTYSGSQPGVVVNPDFDEANITIINDDALIVMFERDSYSVREDAGSLLYRVIANSTASFDYEVMITGADGNATCGLDYHEPVDDSSGTDPTVMNCSYSLTITIPANSSAGGGVVAIINDTIYEGPENFFLHLSVAPAFQAVGINEGSPLRATVEIEDDDELRVFFDPANYSVPEGENQVLVLRTDKEFAVPFTIDVTLRDGSAVAPGDYEDRSYQVVFNVTTQTGTLVVHTETDNVIENNEDFTAVLSVPADLTRVSEWTPSEATVTILDRTTAEVYFDPATYNVTEGQPADLILRLTSDVDPSVTITVMVQTMDGSATDGADYTGGLLTATFSGSSTTSVPVLTLTDDVLEGLEYFTGVIQVPPETTTNYRVTAGSPDTAMVNIIDATIAGVYFDPDVYPVNEGDNVTLILKTNVTVNKRFSVLVNTYDDSANSPEDYQGGETRAIFEIGSNMTAVVYSTVNDGTREGIESFIANLTVPPEMQAMGVVPGMPDRATVNIIDDEVLVCMLVRTMHEVSEDMGPLVAMVMCSIPSDEPFTLIVQTSDDTAVDGEDYTGGDYPVIFPAGSTKESFSIPITDDDIFELDETFFLTLVIPRPAQDIGVMRGVPFMATVTIINDEPTVTIDIERRVIDVIENQTFVEVCLVKSGPSSRPVMALVNADELTGNAGSPVTIDATSLMDFEPIVPEIILAPSETRSCVNVTIIDDEIVERTEPFEVIITFPPDQPALQIGEIVPNATQINGTIIIIDDDVITVQFEQDMYMVNESDGMVDVTVIASGRTSFEYTFTVTPMDLTATNTLDYNYSTTTYSFGPTDENEPIPSHVISIPIINDGDNELNETFKLTLEVSADGEAANVTEGPISMTEVLIKDDDDVTVTFSPQNYTVIEGEPAPLMIILDKPAAKDITVTVTTMDITATETDDYIGGSFDVSIPAGSVKVTLNVSTLRDDIVELPEYFKASLSLPGAPEGCVVGTPDMSYITVIDNTTMIPVHFNPANYSVKEGVNGSAVIVLEALADHDFDFTVTVNSRDGTAIDGSDYTGGLFEVAFPAGVNMVSFSVPILDDAIAECAKLFNLDLDIPEAAADMGVFRESPDTATVHIMDDDVEDLLLSIENADYMVKENVVSFVATVVASREADFNYTVTVETSDGTAVGGDDFVSQQYLLTFPAGQTRADFTVVITDDNVIESMESFQLLLSIPEDLISKGVQVEPNSAATVTIMDNDVQVKFRQSSVATTEEEGRVLVTVDAMGDLSSDFSIIVMAINGSAVEPFDFTGNMWPVDFLANQASASFEISIVQDNLPEIPEEFSLKIVIESPYTERVTVGEPPRLTVVITDRKNDTVRGDPLFSVPLPSKYTAHTELESIQLCFEIHGEAGKHYNLISDACTSVSAQYKQGENDAGLNVISNIGVKAQESSGSCHEIEVDLVGCSAQLDGTLLNTSVTVNGISIMIRRQRVRVSVPNCASSTRLTMWMMCMRRNNEDMLELVVARGDGLDPTAHGLIGQFWNIPVNITSYTGPYGDGTAAASDRIYSVTVAYPNATERTFIADYGKKDWLDGRPCLYAGNHNGGPIGEVKDSGSVIQGKYSNYEVADLFATNYTFSKFKANC